MSYEMDDVKRSMSEEKDACQVEDMHPESIHPGGIIRSTMEPGIKIPSPKDPWVHRSDRMLCKTCIYYMPKESSEKGWLNKLGRCRRHAPTMSGYPVVFPTDWCGDHKLDENRA